MYDVPDEQRECTEHKQKRQQQLFKLTSLE
jgi:hypothetical protein